MKRLRVLIVEDSRTIRERLVEVLGEDPGFEIVGQVGDGPAALRLVDSVRPDIISLDMVLPGMSGLEVTRRVMSTRATPILVVSASVNRGEAFDTLDALQAGAVDVFEKSRMGRDPTWEVDLKAALRLVARIRVVTRPRPRDPPEWAPASEGQRKLSLGHGNLASARETDRDSESRIFLDSRSGFRGVAPSLIVLGASTGGPAAIAQILGELPADFRLPILIVMHMAPLFAVPLADWLGRHTSLPVRIAIDGEPVPSPRTAACVLLAPAERHLIIDAGRLRFTMDPERHSCRPSVDVLFESAALECGPRAIGGLLTGMGRDGAAGLLALRQVRALTFAQDASSCVVFGMPREAIQLGAAELVLPLGQIAANLVSFSMQNWKGTLRDDAHDLAGGKE
jgi:two-component system chemotaxis response regulator CheB